MKRYLRVIETTLGASWITLAGVILAAVLVIPQVSQLIYYASVNSDSRAVIGARDDDAGNAIDIASHSHWFTSNGFYPYGPVYFRVAHMFGAAMSPLSQVGDLPEAEARSKSYHLALLLTSLLAACLLAFQLASPFAVELWAKLGVAVWIFWALLHSSVWQTFLLRAHPDWLLALTMAVATMATVRAWKNPEDERLRRMSAWAWGLTLSVKMTVLFWLPFVGLSLFLPWRKENLRSALRYGGHAALVFFAVGFPQNFNLYKIIRFLHTQSLLSAPADLSSVTEWIQLWSAQIAVPAAVILAFALATCTLAQPNWRLTWRSLLLAFGPAALLMAQKVLAPHAHYPMPVVATHLALLASLAPVRRRLSGTHALWFLFASVLAFSFVNEVPASFNDSLSEQMVCRDQARATAKDLRELTAQSKRIYVDPYVPVMSHLPGVVLSTWTMSRDYLKQNDFDILVLSKHFHGRYQDGLPTEYARRDNPEWSSAVEVYLPFKDVTEVNTPELGHWHQVKADACGWQVWERVRP